MTLIEATDRPLGILTDRAKHAHTNARQAQDSRYVGTFAARTRPHS